MPASQHCAKSTTMHNRDSATNYRLGTAASAITTSTAEESFLRTLGRKSDCLKPTMSTTNAWKDAKKNATGEVEHHVDVTETDLTTTARTDGEDIVIQEDFVRRPPVRTKSRSMSVLDNLVRRLREVNDTAAINDNSLSAEAPNAIMGREERGSAALLSIEDMTQLLQQTNRSDDVAAAQSYRSIQLAGSEESFTTLFDMDAEVPCIADIGTSNARQPARSFGGRHSPLLPLSELMGRLERVNAQASAFSKRSNKLDKVLKRRNKASRSIEMAHVLDRLDSKVAAAAAASGIPTRVARPMQEDPPGHLPQGINYEPLQVQSLDRSVLLLGTLQRRQRIERDQRAVRKSQSLCSRRSFEVGRDDSFWTEEECGSNESAVPIVGTAAAAGAATTPFNPPTDEEPSLSFEDLYDHAPLATEQDDDSEFSLHATRLSCDSSVTWYEHADIDEISIDEDSLGEQEKREGGSGTFS